MEFIVRAMRAYAVPLVLPIARSWKVFDDEGQIQNEQIEAQLLNIGREVARDARLFTDSGESDYASEMKVRSGR
jgi:FMN reductase